jgi:hypothetical protein
MNIKMSILIIAAVTALSTIGYSYSCLNGGIQTNCCVSNCAVVFTKVTTWDNEILKDVGHVRAQIACTGDTINVCIDNGYPCYRAYVNYTIQNKGQFPFEFLNITIINPQATVLEITASSLPSAWFQPGQTTQGQVMVHVLQPAKQSWQYKFQIKINVACKTVKPCTADSWQQEFSRYLCKQGDPQISATTLEQYLSKIASQSKVFSFTGTQGQKFLQALSILTPTGQSSMDAKLKAQLFALWLNYIAGWTESWTLQGMSPQQIIQGSENALINHQTTRYEYWKNLCGSFNGLAGE